MAGNNKDKSGTLCFYKPSTNLAFEAPPGLNHLDLSNLELCEAEEKSEKKPIKKKK